MSNIPLMALWLKESIWEFPRASMKKIPSSITTQKSGGHIGRTATGAMLVVGPQSRIVIALERLVLLQNRTLQPVKQNCQSRKRNNQRELWFSLQVAP